MAVYVNFRAGHKPDKFIISSNLTEKPIVDAAAFNSSTFSLLKCSSANGVLESFLFSVWQSR